MKVPVKYILLLIIVAVLPLSKTHSQDDNMAKFNQGVDHYSELRYTEALKVWTDLYNTGYSSAALCYNIGNAHFKLNNVPGAILFYERAHLLKPADSNISYNLQIARSRVVDKFEEIPGFFFIRWFDFLSLLLPSNIWATMSIVTFVTFLILLSLYIYSSVYRTKVISFWAAVALLVISSLSFAFAIHNKTLVYDSRRAVIFAPVVNGKSSPDSSGTDLFVLHEGSSVTIEDSVGEWFEIRLSDGNKGWVPEECLEMI